MVGVVMTLAGLFHSREHDQKKPRRTQREILFCDLRVLCGFFFPLLAGEAERAADTGDEVPAGLRGEGSRGAADDVAEVRAAEPGIEQGQFVTAVQALVA